VRQPPWEPAAAALPARHRDSCAAGDHCGAALIISFSEPSASAPSICPCMRLTWGRRGAAAVAPPSEDDAVATARVASAFIRTTLDAETARRDRLEQRAANLVATTGGLVTVVGAIGALVPKAAGFRLPAAAVPPLIAALALFLAAVVLAQSIHLPSSEVVVASSALTDLAGATGSQTEAQLLRQIAATDVRVAAALRVANARRTRTLAIATIVQMLAVAALAVAVAVTLIALRGR